MNYLDVIERMYSNKDYKQLNNFIKELQSEYEGIELALLLEGIKDIVGNKYYKNLQLN